MKNRCRLNSLAHSLMLAGLLHSFSVVADDADAERIVITGSHIKRIDQETSSPVLVIDQESIKQSGARTLTELLQMSPYTGAGSFNEAFTTGFTPGAAAFDLRGFGPERTLTLVNGRRRAIYPFGANGSTAFVDFNSIPLASIKRIEILKDGASALYGSDAVAGVVNIITEDGFVGSEIQFNAQATDGGGGEDSGVQFKWGTSTTSTEWLVAFDASKRNELLGSDRDNTASLNGPFFDARNRYSGEGFSIDLTNDTVIPGENCLPENLFSLDPATGYTGQLCLYDYAEKSQLLPEAERYAVDFSFTYHFDNVSLSIQVNQVNVESISTGFFDSATPVFEQMESANTVYFTRRAVEFGTPTVVTESKTNNVVVALNGTVGQFEWDGSLYTVRNDVDENYTDGWMLNSKYIELQHRIGLGDFDLRQHFSTNVIDDYSESFWHLGQSNIDAVDWHTSGPVIDTGYGPIWMATGVEHRKESFYDRSHDAIINREVLGLGASGAEGDRDVSAAFVEFAIPAGDYVEFSTSVRYDSYGDFGDTTNPKVGLSVRPVDSLLFRGSWGTGFRAPGLHQLFTGLNAGSSGGFPFIQMGNLALEPEQSESAVAGLLFAPSSMFEFQFDYWKIEIDNIINDYGVSTILTLCPSAFDANGNEENTRCDEWVLRVNENGNGNPVNVTSTTINNQFLNLAGMRGEGYDLSLRFAFDDVLGGKLKWQTDIAHLKSLEEQAAPDTDYVEYQGTRATPEDRASTSLVWKGDSVTHAIISHVVGEWSMMFSDGSSREVKQYSQWDYQFGVDVFSSSHLTIGIKNVDDKAPQQVQSSWPYFNRSLYSAMGRTVVLGWQTNF